MPKLHEHFEKRAITEMKHAEKLIGRVLFLEGSPTVTNLKKISIGADVPKQLENDHAAEEGAIKAYNAGIQLAGEVGDFAAQVLLPSVFTVAMNTGTAATRIVAMSRNE